MGGLQNFENRLEQMISGVFARAFRSAVQPVEISAALQRELDNNAQILSRERRLVPNSFHVELSTTDLERLAPYDNALAEGAHRDAARARRVAELRLPRPGQDRLRQGRRPDHRPVPGAQRRRGEGHHQRHEHDVRPRQGLPRGQRRPQPAQPARAGRRARHRRRPADQRPRHQPPARRVPDPPGHRRARRRPAARACTTSARPTA